MDRASAACRGRVNVSRLGAVGIVALAALGCAPDPVRPGVADGSGGAALPAAASPQPPVPVESPVPRPERRPSPQAAADEAEGKVQHESLAVSPGGRLIASGLGPLEGAIEICEGATGKRLRTLKVAGGGPVYRMAFSPDGQRLAAKTERGVVLWDTATWKGGITVPGADGDVTFTPDGQLVTCDSLGHVMLRDPATGQARRTLETRERLASITRLAFSPDGSLLAAGLYQGLQVWDLRSGAALFDKKGLAAGVTAVAFSPDAKLLAFAVDNEPQGTPIRLVDARTGAEVRTLTGHREGVSALLFRNGGRQLVSAGRDHSLRVWDAASGRTERVLTGEPAIYTGAGLLPDGRTLVTVSTWKIEFWDLETGLPRAPAPSKLATVYSVALLGNGTGAVTGHAEGGLALWDLASGRVTRSLKVGFGMVESVVPAPDGSSLALTCMDRTLLWSPDLSRQLRSLELGAPVSPARALAFSRDGKRVAVAADNLALVLDPATGECLHRLSRSPRAVSSVAFSPDGSLLAAGDYAGTVALWDPRTGKPVREIASGYRLVWAVDFAPDGKTLALSIDPDVQLRDPQTGGLLATLPGQPGEAGSFPNIVDGRSGGLRPAEVLSVRFSPDGRFVAAGAEGSVRLWEVASRKLRWVHEVPRFTSRSLSFSPDGRQLAILSRQGVELLGTADGRPLKVLPISDR